jgi:hypothetical protein
VADLTEITVIALEIVLSCVRCDGTGGIRVLLATPRRITACEGCGESMVFSASVPSFVDRDAPWRA